MKIHQIDGYIQQLYLAEYEQKLMLLDGACRADIPYIERFITQELNKPFDSLKVVVVTHMHPDHAGAAHKLRDLVGCKVVSADRERQWYQGVDGALMHLTDLLLARWVAKRLNRSKQPLWYARFLSPDYTLVDGQVIPLFEDWQVLETPGHTDRDLSLYHQQTDTLYVADLMVEVKKQLISPFPVFHPNKYRKSVTKVFEMKPKRLLVAHGGEVEFDQESYQHLIATAPITPSTHWRAIKSKARGMLAAIRRK
jgi:glyoxylase-like metal-dependent hydrolase (beta-lactamase superfamily II)